MGLLQVRETICEMDCGDSRGGKCAHSDEGEPRASKASQLRAGPLMQFVNPPHKCVAAQNPRMEENSSVKYCRFGLLKQCRTCPGWKGKDLKHPTVIISSVFSAVILFCLFFSAKCGWQSFLLTDWLGLQWANTDGTKQKDMSQMNSTYLFSAGLKYVVCSRHESDKTNAY